MQLSIRRSAAVLAACASSFVTAPPLVAAAQDDSADVPAPSGNGSGSVARVSLLDGRVAIQRGDANDSLAAALNAPVLGGDYIVTGDQSRAEIQIDGYAAVRVGQNVQMRFTQLEPHTRDVQLAAGTIDVRLYREPDATTAIDTPSISIKPQRRGSYRVTVTSDGRTLVTVRAGDAQIDTPQGQQDLRPGDTLVAQGDADNPAIQTQAPIADDAFDGFNAERDAVYARAATTAAYVNGQIDGLSDLNGAGRFVDDGSYGQVWVPAVDADWAPYRDGRWVWEDGYGWTWIAAEPWGWAPYHYGSWYHSPTYGWAWYPPRPSVAVIWRPALVAFIGFGGGDGSFALGFAGGVGFANIGWVPLAPFEPYHPWWGGGYGRNIVNVTNVTNVTNVNVYRNARYNAVSSVSSQRFIAGDFTHNAAVSAPELTRATVFHGAPPVVPTESNLRFAHTATPPTVALRPAIMHAPFAGNSATIERTPFTMQRSAFATATHAAMTPLHFKDPQTTPLVTAAPNADPHAVPHAVPVAGRPAAPAPAAAWDRFNDQRAPTNAYHQPAQPNADHLAAHSRSYHEPAQPAYHQPASHVYHPAPRPNEGHPAPAEHHAAPAPHPNKTAAHDHAPPQDHLR